MRNDLKSQKEELKKEMQDVLEEARALYEEAAANGGKGLEDIGKKIQAKFGGINDKIGSLFDGELGEKAKETVSKADELVKDKPYYAMGAAAALGLVFGMLLNRNR